MNSSIVRLFLAAGMAATLAACGGGNSTSTDTTTTTTDSNAMSTTTTDSNASSTATSADATAAYQKFFAGEDNAFADLKGNQQKSDDKTLTIFASNAQLPGKSDCTINVNGDSKATLANCEYTFTSKAEADAMMATLKSNAMAAESGLTETTMKLEKGNVSQFYAKNDKHAVEVYTQKDKGHFLAGIYFATPDDFKKTWGDNT